MYWDLTTQKFYPTRKDAKIGVGGQEQFNWMYKHKHIIFVRREIFERMKLWFEENKIDNNLDWL